MAAGLILPPIANICANTEAMNLHLAEIASAIAPGAHAVLVFDGAGWHGGKDPVVPLNLTPLTLPTQGPELNPGKNVWQDLRANKLVITVFDAYDEILDQCCAARNFFANDPAAITSITSRDWAAVNVWGRWYDFQLLLVPDIPAGGSGLPGNSTRPCNAAPARHAPP